MLSPRRYERRPTQLEDHVDIGASALPEPATRGAQAADVLVRVGDDGFPLSPGVHRWAVVGAAAVATTSPLRPRTDRRNYRQSCPADLRDVWHSQPTSAV